MKLEINYTATLPVYYEMAFLLYCLPYHKKSCLYFSIVYSCEKVVRDFRDR